MKLEIKVVGAILISNILLFIATAKPDSLIMTLLVAITIICNMFLLLGLYFITLDYEDS